MLDDPIIISACVVVAFYGLTWLGVPSQSGNCPRCEGKVSRIRRKRWQRVLSLVFPLVNVRCTYCGQTGTRRRSPLFKRK